MFKADRQRGAWRGRGNAELQGLVWDLPVADNTNVESLAGHCEECSDE